MVADLSVLPAQVPVGPVVVADFSGLEAVAVDGYAVDAGWGPTDVQGGWPCGCNGRSCGLVWGAGHLEGGAYRLGISFRISQSHADGVGFSW